MPEPKPSYSNFTSSMNVMAKSHPFASYDAVVATVTGWRSNRMSVMEHVGSMLKQASSLGEYNFFGREKRFGASVPTGDLLYIDLANNQIATILNSMVISLQSVQGEGKVKRAIVKEAGKEAAQGEGDAALNVAHQLGQLRSLLQNSSFLSEAVFDQEKFEQFHDIKWSSS